MSTLRSRRRALLGGTLVGLAALMARTASAQQYAPGVSGYNPTPAALAITRAQIAANKIHVDTFIVSGYATAGDRGADAVYTSVGAGSGGPAAIQDANGVWFNLVVGGAANVGWFGAAGDGTTDDSAAFQAAFTYANTQYKAAGTQGRPVMTAAVYIPSGDYNIVTGSTLADTNINVVGDGPESTRITLGSGITFLTVTGTIYQFELTGVATSGGAQVLAHTRTGGNVHGHCHFENCDFTNYTVCGIGTLSVDFPYWRVYDCTFRGAAALSSIGIVLSVGSDGSAIERNEFLTNLYGVKILTGNATYIENNDFVRFQASGGSPQVDIWVVPSPISANSGQGFTVRANKFGNENLATTDLRILIADEGSGTNSFDKHHSTSVSTGYFTGWNIDGNLFSTIGGMLRGIIYSYTPNICFGRFNNVQDGGAYPYIVQFDAGVTFTVENYIQYSSLFVQPLSSVSTFDVASTQVSNANPGMALTDDAYALQAGATSFRQHYQSGFDAGYAAVATLTTSSPGTVNCSTSPITDAVGGPNASTVTYSTAAGFAYVGVTNADLQVGRAAWCEFDFQQGPSNAITQIKVIFRYDDASEGFSRILNVPVKWQTVRIPFIVVENATGVVVRFTGTGYTGSTNELNIGRCRVYHATEPVSPASRYLENSATFNPPSLGAGTSQQTTVTVTGAVVGDFALASFSLANADIYWGATVTSADTATVTQTNRGSGSVDLGSGTLSVRILKL